MIEHNAILAEISHSSTKTLENENKEKGFITFTMKDRGFVGNTTFEGWDINFIELKEDKL